MKAERIVLSFIAILIGLFVAGIVFFFIQVGSQKQIQKKHVIDLAPSPTTTSKTSTLSISSPTDESVSATKSVKLEGKALPGSTVVISTESGQSVVAANKDGTFSDTLSLDDGVNLVYITAISQNGEEESVLRTVTYSSENY